MIGLIIRGAFFLSVVGWYSTSLWKMIDNYFQDQFKRYLATEFEKNPRMREDMLNSVAAIDKNDITVTDQNIEVKEFLDTCNLDSCDAVGNVDHNKYSVKDESMPLVVDSIKETGAVIAEVEDVEKEVDRPTFHVNTKAEPPDKRFETTKTTEIKYNDDDEDSSITNEISQELEQEGKEDKIEEQQTKLEQPPVPQEKQLHQQQQQQLVQPAKHPQQVINQKHQKQNKKQPSKTKSTKRKKRKSRSGPLIGAKSEAVTKRKLKQRNKHQPLILTEDDFILAANKRRYTDEDDKDFLEFDNEANGMLYDYFNVDEEEILDSVLVTELPFKPAIDIYDLERVSRDEYCPLTLEDDPSCDETRAWTLE